MCVVSLNVMEPTSRPVPQRVQKLQRSELISPWPSSPTSPPSPLLAINSIIPPQACVSESSSPSLNNPPAAIATHLKALRSYELEEVKFGLYLARRGDLESFRALSSYQTSEVLEWLSHLRHREGQLVSGLSKPLFASN